MDFKEYFKEQAEFFNSVLNEYIPLKQNPQSIVYDAMRYSLLAGGKRLRPILMSECCIMCGGNREMIVPFAAGMEMIHTYSLIHDDLPTMDNDSLRRGRPTNHIKYGEANAILAGDALLNKAFEVMSAENELPADVVIRAINTISVSSGTEGMIGGQIVDIETEGKDITLDELKYIHSLKTGAIIRSSCTVGAIIAEADNESVLAVDSFAVNLGIAFQIQDDILDVEGNTAELGKNTGSDVNNGKNTYVSICGIEKARTLMREYSEKAYSALDMFGERAEFLKWLTEYLIHRQA